MLYTEGQPVKNFLLTALLAVTTPLSWASTESLKSVGLEAKDKDGCYLSDGNKILGPTIGLMVDAYDHHPKLPNQTITAIIQTAIDAGCSLNEVNAFGLSPLNSAILLNHPVLVKLLLNSGANPKLKISSSRDYIDSKDSFQLYEFLKAKKDMTTIGETLENYR